MKVNLVFYNIYRNRIIIKKSASKYFNDFFLKNEAMRYELYNDELIYLGVL